MFVKKNTKKCIEYLNNRHQLIPPFPPTLYRCYSNPNKTNFSELISIKKKLHSELLSQFKISKIPCSNIRLMEMFYKYYISCF